MAGGVGGPDTEPDHLTYPDPTAVSDHIGEVIARGTTAAGRSLLEAAVDLP